MKTTMKSILMRMTVVAGLALLPTAPLFAEKQTDSQAQATENAESSDVWLGMVTKQLPKLVAEHLGLAPGTGLVVEMVVPDSPAAKAGVAKDDVLVKLGDQKLVLPEQLQPLLQGNKSGDVVKLEILRDQNPMTLSATLAPRPAEYARQAHHESAGPKGADNDPFLADAFDGFPDDPNLQAMQQHIERLRRQMEKMQGNLNLPNGQVNMQVFRLDQGKVSINDGNGSITIEKKNGKMNLTAKDKDGKLMYDGPYSNDEEKAQVPEEIRKRAGRFKFEDGAMRFDQMFGGADAEANAGGGVEIDGDVNPGEKPD